LPLLLNLARFGRSESGLEKSDPTKIFTEKSEENINLPQVGNLREVRFPVGREVSRPFKSCQEVTPDSALFIGIRRCLPHPNSLRCNIGGRVLFILIILSILSKNGNSYTFKLRK